MTTTEARRVDDAGVRATARAWFENLPRAARAGAGTAAKSPCTWLVTVAFVLYAGFAYNQYSQLQVGACDLGIFYQAAHGWAFHGWPMVPIKGYTQLGDHFSPAFILLAPLLWIHDSPLTVVIAQALLLVLSAIPVYRVVLRAWSSQAIASVITAAYLLSIGIQGSVAFPVHEVMFSAPLIAWGLERALAGRWTAASVLIGCTVFVKEDMGLLVVMFALFALRNRKWRHALALFLWGAFMFVLCLKVLIPHLNPNGFTYSSDYAKTLHSDNFPDAIKFMLSHPGNTLHAIFNNPVKRDTWLHILAPVAFLCLASPIALLALPTMLSRMLSDRDTEWSWFFYYDMALMPIVFIGAVDGLQRLAKLTRWATAKYRSRQAAPEPGDDSAARGRFRLRGERLAAGLFALFALGVTLDYSHLRPLDQWIRLGGYTSNEHWAQDVRHALELIPPGVEVRATNNLVVPLAASNTATLVGSNVDKGDWAAIDTANPQCPIDASAIPRYMADLKRLGFVEVKEFGPILIMHKG